jgi:hypothetical protein
MTATAPRSRPRVELLEDRAMPANVVLHWNEILLQSLSTPTGSVPAFRNMALVSVAMFDAVNAIDGSYEPYYADVDAPGNASKKAAAAQAAHDTLVALYPTREAIFDAALAEDLARIPAHRAQLGIAVGQEVARQILALRSDDGSGTAMTWTPPDDDPGTYQLTGPNFAAAGNVHVPFITPFAVETTSQFRPGPHPALDSPEYAADLNEVKVVGASDADEAGVDRDGNGLPDRTADQTLVAELWRTPVSNVSVWNRIAQNQVATNDLSVEETARLFALLNVSLNDGLLTSNESKYHYELWRPITAIQRADEDGNDLTEAEPDWMTEHPSTPPYPAYASNASTIGAACATVLTDVFGGDVAFTVDWSQGPRSYDNFWDAANEQADARIYGGIHFRFDCVAGQEIGADVGAYVLENYLLARDNSSGAGSGSVADGAASSVEEGLAGVAPVFAAPDSLADISLGTDSGDETVTAGDLSEAAPVAPTPAALPPASSGDDGLADLFGRLPGTDLAEAGADWLSVGPGAELVLSADPVR